MEGVEEGKGMERREVRGRRDERDKEGEEERKRRVQGETCGMHWGLRSRRKEGVFVSVVCSPTFLLCKEAPDSVPVQS